MKKIGFIFLAFIVGLHIGCKQEYITLSGDLANSDTLTFYADDTNRTGIGFRTTGPWQVAVHDTTWLTLNPVDPADQQNEGGHFIKFTLKKYLTGATAGERRINEITISNVGGGDKVTLFVVQLDVTKAGKKLQYVNFNNDSDKEHTSFADITEGATISMETADSWTADIQPMTVGEPAPDWIKLLQTQGDKAGSYLLYPTLRPNTTGIQRQAKIVIRCKGYDFEVPFTQTATTANNQIPTLNSSERTVLIYMSGNDKAKTDTDINEMLAGIGSVNVEINNLLVYAATGSTTELYRISKENTGKGIKQLLRTYDAGRNSVGLTEIQEIFSLVATTYPAQHNALVLWSMSPDWLTQSTASLQLPTLKTALQQSLPANQPLDYILFDSNFMQAIEVAYELRNVAHYFIGTPAEVPMQKANYTTLIPKMFISSNPTDTIAISVADSYFKTYQELYKQDVAPSGDQWTGGIAMSVVDGSKLTDLANQTAAILPAVIEKFQTIPADSLLNYDHRSTTGYVGHYDLGALVKQVTDPSQYEVWLTAYRAAVLHPQTTPQNYSDAIGSVNKSENFYSMRRFTGASMYMPGSSDTLDALYKQLEWYSAAGWQQTGQ